MGKAVFQVTRVWQADKTGRQAGQHVAELAPVHAPEALGKADRKEHVVLEVPLTVYSDEPMEVGDRIAVEVAWTKVSAQRAPAPPEEGEGD